jgi:hypothetical protein
MPCRQIGVSSGLAAHLCLQAGCCPAVMSVARAARASRSDEKLICLGDIEVALGPDAPPIGLGWISSGRRASRDLGGLGVGKLFATGYLEATLTWRLLLRRATATAFDDTGGQIARETPLGLRPWGSSVMADCCWSTAARQTASRHWHYLYCVVDGPTIIGRAHGGQQPWEVRGASPRIPSCDTVPSYLHVVNPSLPCHAHRLPRHASHRSRRSIAR